MGPTMSNNITVILQQPALTYIGKINTARQSRTISGTSYKDNTVNKT